MRHIVWDWNGTLFDDHHVVVASVNAALERFGVANIDSAGYQRMFTRPLSVFYERLFGHPVDPGLMQEIDDAFQEAYARGFAMASLTGDAADAVDMVGNVGVSQSIASMLRHDLLVSSVKRFGLDEHMLALDGHRGAVGETKEQHLTDHVIRLEEMYRGLSRRGMVVIGDITDDAAAARAAGIGCVLYDGGSQERSRLESEDVPVAATLVEAVGLALG
jgi:phosphoglycolate phosphatase-like HAD superfamily hydrolase